MKIIDQLLMPKRRRILRRKATWIIVGCVGLAALLSIGFAVLPITDEQRIQEKWGVRIEGIRLTASGYMIDFRYRILNPDKAYPLVDRRIKPYLIDEATDAKLVVPIPPKVGPLRQTTRVGKPKEGRTYFVFFANPGRFVKSGNKVTVVIGDFRAQNLTVQ